MRAMVWTQYGSADELRLKEIAKPTPKDHEVLIRIRATTVTMGDTEMRRLKLPVLFALPMRLMFGIRHPRDVIFGQELAGDVEAVGKDVRRFKVGDAVFAAAGLRMGAYAEYICLSETGAIALKPVNISYEEAAAVPVGGLEAVYFLRRGNIHHPGQSVLVNGAGGSIGTVAVQLARYSGAEVTAVDSGDKLNMLRSIGADHVIDYTQEDFTQRGETYDIVYDVVGKAPFAGCVASLKFDGIYLIGNANVNQMIQGRLVSMRSQKKVITGTASLNSADLIYLKDLIDAGNLKPVIDRTYPLEQIADAHRYVESGQKKGNVVIRV